MKTKQVFEAITSAKTVERPKRADYKRIFANDTNRLVPNVPVRALIDTAYDFADKEGYFMMVVGTGGGNWRNYAKQQLKAKPKPKTFSIAQVTLKMAGDKRTLAIELLAGKPTAAIVEKALKKRPPSDGFEYTVGVCPNFGEDLSAESEALLDAEEQVTMDSVERETLVEDADAQGDFIVIQNAVKEFRGLKTPEEQKAKIGLLVRKVEYWLSTHQEDKDKERRAALEKLLPQLQAHKQKFEEEEAIKGVLDSKTGSLFGGDFGKIQDELKKFKESKNIAEQIQLGKKIIADANLWINKHAKPEDAQRKTALQKMVAQVQAHVQKLEASDESAKALDGVLNEDGGWGITQTGFSKIQDDVRLLRKTPDPEEQLKLIDKIRIAAEKWMQEHSKGKVDKKDVSRIESLQKLLLELQKQKNSLLKAYSDKHGNQNKNDDEEDEESPIAEFKEIRLDYNELMGAMKSADMASAALRDDATQLRADINAWLTKSFPSFKNAFPKQAEQAKAQIDAMLESLKDVEEKMDAADELSEYNAILSLWSKQKTDTKASAADKLRRFADLQRRITSLEGRL